MKNLLVTGGSGFIGSHTAITLLRKGYNLIIIDSNINSSSDVIEKIILILKLEGIDVRKNLTFVKGDIRDEQLLINIFDKSIKTNKPIESVVHFAGLKAVNESIKFPLKYWENNVTGTITLLKVMQKFNCKSIVFSSSATIYGERNSFIKIKENSDIKPINIYGKTKEVIENIISSLYSSNYGAWKIAILRYFNPIGAHYSGIIGENPKIEATNIVPIISKVAVRQEDSLQIFGDNWDTKDGTCIRDYIHVMDLAEGHLKALEYISSKESELLKVNLGTGKGTSVLELVKNYEEVNQIKIPYSFTSRREGDIPYSVADNSLAKSLLNWEPKYDIKDMCKDNWNWVSNNLIKKKL